MTIYIIILYVIVILGAFSVFIVNYIINKNNRKNNQAAEQIVKYDFLEHSLRNPYKDAFLQVPSADRRMLAVTIRSGEDKKNLVFDPLKGVSFGKNPSNRIVLRDANVSGKQGVIYVSDNKLMLANVSNARDIELSYGLFKKIRIKPKQTVYLRSSAMIKTGASRIKVDVFVYHYNHK